MPTLLVVESSPRGDHSISRGLTKLFVEEWVKNHPEGRVIERDLMTSNLPFVTMPWLGAYFAPPEQHTPEMKDILRLSDDSLARFYLPTTLRLARRSTTTTFRRCSKPTSTISCARA